MQDVPSAPRPLRAHGADTTSGARAAGSETVLQHDDPDAVPPLWGQAFPAAIWRRVLGERSVVVTVEGGRAHLMAAHGDHLRRLGPLVGGRREIRLSAHQDDWYWIEGEVRSVTWSLAEPVELPPVSVVMPTYRREDAALAQTRRFLRMPVVTSVLVVDQGGTLAEHREFAELLAAHQGLRLISQPNLGGSGGYARGMVEATAQDPAAAVLFSDDDAILSEESLRRMLTYQALCAQPTIMGTPLFSSARPTRLVAHSEAVGRARFQWGAADQVRGGIDLARTTPVDWTFLAPRDEINYTGWWGTLFPPGTVDDLGLPVPLFLKWDDAEYGLRATGHGYRHAVLPGTAVHHPPWTAYRTQMTWTARVLHRNRLAIAAAYDAGRGVIASSFVHQLKHVLAGHLLTAELWEEGIDAVRSGPEGWLGADLGHARADGARVVETWHREHDLAATPEATDRSPLPLPRALAHALGRMVRPDAAPRVVLEVPAAQVHWRTTLGGDALLITDDDGGIETALEVRGSDMRRALGRSVRSHLDLARRWPRLRDSYRRALPEHTTSGSWAALFDPTGTDAPRGTGTARGTGTPRVAGTARGTGTGDHLGRM